MSKLSEEQIALAKSLDLDVLLAAAAFKLGITEHDLDALKAQRAEVLPREETPAAWARAGWRGVGFSALRQHDDDVPLYSGRPPQPSLAELRDCLDFWNHYSSMNEPGQDDIADEKNAMLEKMAGWLRPSGPQQPKEPK
jgi:hypothetical protein